MESYILKENILTDDILKIPSKGKIFKGNYIAIIHEHTFLNSWSDKLTIKKFRKEKTLNKYLKKNYPGFELY
jgi:hypothetical protein